MKTNRKDLRNLFIILSIEMAMILIAILGYGTMIMEGDYLSQHGVFPDMFRQIFYETGNILQDNVFQLGGGQNIYNYSYYGLLSPIVLISYLFPTVNMMNFMQAASGILFISTGILMYIWMRKNYSSNESLIAALIMIFVPCLLYEFQNQIVFVECLPFVLLSLMAVDKKLKTGNNAMLIIALTFTIFVNYYSSIVSLICIMTYYGYQYMAMGRKVTIKAIWQIIRPVLISILIAGVLLIPTAYVILHGIRVKHQGYCFIDLFLIPDYMELYNPSAMGITIIFIFVAVALLFNSKKIIAEKFLMIILLLFTFQPTVLYALNGGNYIRNKMSIPLWPLWILAFVLVYKKIKENKLKYKASLVIFTLLSVVAIILKNVNDNMSSWVLIVDFLFALIAIIICRFTSKKWVLPLYTILSLASFVVGMQIDIEKAASFPDDDACKQVVEKVLEDEGTYRITNNIRRQFNINKVYHNDYLSTGSYTSTQNKYYWEFYSRLFGNNDYYRNYLMLGGQHNAMFNTFMGVKYVLDDAQLQDKDYRYLYSDNNINVYENENRYPLIYGKKESVAMKDFNRMPFPYSLDCIMNNVITDYEEPDEDIIKATVDEKQLDERLYDSGRIIPYESERIKDKYEIKLKESKSYSMKLSKPITDKYLIIEFKVEQKDSDLQININGCRNLLSSKTAVYDNKNYKFKYILSSDSPLTQLDIYIKGGVYQISDVKMYTYNFDSSKVKMDKGEDIHLDYGKSEVTAKINTVEDEYLVTSFPYDEGWTIYIDGKEAEKEIVNTSFLGCKITKGQHKIRITYRSNWKTAGIVCTCVGMILFCMEVVFDIRRKSKEKYNNA